MFNQQAVAKLAASSWLCRVNNRPRLCLAALLLVFSVVSCSPDSTGVVGDNQPPRDPGQPKHGGHLRVALEGETNNWLPGRGNHVAPAALTVAMALFDPLVRLDLGAFHAR